MTAEPCTRPDCLWCDLRYWLIADTPARRARHLAAAAQRDTARLTGAET